MTNRRGTNIQGRLLLHFTRNKGKLVNLPDIMEALGETDTSRVLAAISRLKAREELGKLEIVVRGTTYRFYPAPQLPEGDTPPVPNSARAIASGQTELKGRDHGPAFDSDRPSPEQARAKEMYDRHVAQGPIESDAPLCAHGDPQCDCLVEPQTSPPKHARTDDPRPPARHGAFTSERPARAFAHPERLFQEIGVGRPEGREALPTIILKCEDGTVWRAVQI